MTIPSKFNPFGITKNKNKIPTDYVVYNSLNGIITTPEVGSLFTVTGTSPTNVNKDGINCAYFAGNGGIKQTGQSYWTQSNPVLTLSIWAKCLNTNNAGALCTGVWISGKDTFEIMKMTDWKLVGCGDEIHAPNVDIAKWHHVLGIVDNVNKVKKLYIDNQLINTLSSSSSWSVENNVAIGGNFNGSRNIPRDSWFKGYLAAARIYNRVLSEDEIKLLASEFHPIYEITATDQEYTFSPANTSSVSIVYSSDGGTVNSFEIISGSLPSNISFDTSTGTFSGIATSDADHTYNLVIKLSGPDVIAKTINYTVKTSATSTLTATSPQTFNFTTEDDMQIQMIQVTRDDEYIIENVYSGELPPGIVKHYSGKDAGFRSNGNQTEDITSSVVMALTTNYHPSPVYVTCNFNITQNQIIASNQAFTFYSADGVKTKQIQYTSAKSITPVYNISGTLPSGITFNSATGEFTSDGSQTVQEIETIQLTISSSTGYSKPAVILITLDVEIGESPIPDDYVFYASLSSVVNTAETGQSLSYRNSTPSATIDGINCLYFNNNSGIYSTSTTGMPTGTSPWTMSIWAYILDINRSSVALSMGTTSSYRSPYFGYHGTTKNYLYGTWGWDITTNTTAKLNTWVNFILTYDGTTVKFYADNELIASENKNLNVQYGGIYIGSHCNNYNIFYGYLARARIYNRVLSDNEISKLSNEFKTFIEIPDQTINFDASQGAETIALDYSTNLSGGIVFGLSGTLPTGITFDSTSGSFTSDGTQATDESAEVIVSGSYNDGITNISASAIININVYAEEPVGPVIPTSGLTMYHSLSSSLTHPEIGSDFTVVGNGCTLTTQDGIQCMQITPPENGFSYLEYSGSNEYYSNSNTEITVSIWAKFIGQIQYSTDAHCFMLGQWVGDFKQMYLCTFRQKYGIKICGGDDWQNWGFTADNRWHHLVGTSNSSGLTKFYVDGTLCRTYQLNGSLNITNDYVVIGSHMNQNWNGYLAGARIYNRVLSDDEIETLSKEYDVSDPIITDSLTMYMPMKTDLNAVVGTPLSSVMTNAPSATVEDGIKCYYFDGSNCLYGDDASYFTTFNSSDAPHCTLCYWFKYDTTSQLERFAAQIGYQDNDYTGCIHYNFTWNDAPQICQSQYGHWTEPLILGSEAANGWHLYVIRIQTWDFGEGEYWIYQDGYVNSTECEGSGRGFTWGNFCVHPMIAIGGQVSLTNHSTGNIDCIKGWYTGIRMYNKVLSAEEIAAIAAEFPTSN